MFKILNQLVACAALLLPTLLILAEPADAEQTELSMPQLEKRIETIDIELSQLSHFSPRSGIGAIGFRSTFHSEPDNKEWIRIDLEKEETIDEVVLVPIIWRKTEQGYQADSFPKEFNIQVGSSSDKTGSVIARFTSNDSILSRSAPLVIPIPPTKASWVRIEATKLSLRKFDRRYVLQLAEVLLFSGTENVALRCPVATSSNARDRSGAWDKKFLTDGFTPYLMNSAQGEQSRAYVSKVGEKPNLVIDLGNEYPVSRIHLHAVDQSASVPQAYKGDLGIPDHLKVEGANHFSFSDAVTLLEYQKKNINDSGPIMMWHLPETNCRYIRVSDVTSNNSTEAVPYEFRIGFAEIELFSEGVNIALGKPVIDADQLTYGNRNPVSLTDGNNLYGRILPTRIWMEELARRHDLETLRPVLADELSHRYDRQKVVLSRMKWLTTLIAVAILIYILVNHNLQLRRINRIKNRFAADLHDELGANIHTIGLLGDLAKESIDSPEDLIDLLDRSRVFTERSGAAVRYCTNMMEAETLCEDLEEEMLRSSNRLLADLKHKITFEGEEILHQLKPRKRIDLFFFYKECLNNIIRHSGATEVTTHLVATANEINLTVHDNGHGIHDSAGNGTPSSLKRRAKLLRARVNAEHSIENGTTITLKLSVHKWDLKREQHNGA